MHTQLCFYGLVLRAAFGFYFKSVGVYKVPRKADHFLNLATLGVTTHGARPLKLAGTPHSAWRRAGKGLGRDRRLPAGQQVSPKDERAKGQAGDGSEAKWCPCERGWLFVFVFY